MRLIRQRKRLDCGVACLAMVAGVTYARAYRALRSFDEDAVNGLTNGDIIAAAWQLGVHLVPVRGSKRPQSYKRAIARIRWSSGALKKGSPGGHFVCISGEDVLCPMDGRKKLSVYLDQDGGRICTALVVQ